MTSRSTPAIEAPSALRNGWMGELLAILPLISRRRRLFALAVTSSITARLATLGVLGIVGWVVGKVVFSHWAAMAPWTGMCLAGAVLLAALTRWAESRFSHDFAFRLIETLQIGLYDGLERAAPGYVLGKRTGDLASVVTSDAMTLEWFFAHMLADYISATVVPIVILSALALLHPALSFVLLPFLPIAASVPFWLAKRAGEEGQRVRAATGELNAEIVEGIQAIREIILLGYGDGFLKRLSLLGSRLSGSKWSYGSRAGLEQAAIELVLTFAMAAALSTSLFLASRGLINVALVPLIIMVSGAALTPIAEVSRTARRLGELRASAGRVRAILGQPAAVHDSGCLKLPACSQRGVQFVHVSFAYTSGQVTLRDVDFSIAPGDTVALVGRSGSGKTTCANLLMRFWDVGTGRITLDGVDIRSLPIQTLRKHVTSMSQDTYLFDISVRDNIRFGAPGASDAAVFEAASAAGADGFIRELPQGYDTSCGERGARLSGGQRQRVAIARAFLHNPDVLVMDESVSSLDAENERILQDSLRSIRRGRTTLIIAHRLSTIRTADRIIVLDDGMVAESGTHEELLRRGGIYCTLVNDAAHGVVG